jgi:hypothetical protein
MTKETKLAEVIAVYPNKVKISVDNLDAFKSCDEQLEELKVGSYLEISDDKNCKLIAIIESYLIEVNEDGKRKYIIEANPLGTIIGEKFTRGGDSLTIPPTSVQPAKHDDIDKIYQTSIKDKEKFCFSKLAQDERINVPVNGDKFFNKHFAIVGSTGSGKSHTVAKILQEAISSKNGEYDGLNNSHIVLFDIHGEYKEAFPTANHISADIKIPYWLFDSDELGDLFIESNESNSHNQISQFRYAVTENKKKLNSEQDQNKIYFDSPLKFSIDGVIKYIKNINNEFVNKKNNRTPTTKTGEIIHDRLTKYFEEELEFDKVDSNYVNGPYTGDFERFVLRLENTRHNPRLKFLFENVENMTVEDVLKQFLGYQDSKSNITVVDLSGIPFEVLSITVSLISRILFEYGYFYKKLLDEKSKDCETPLVLIYEEAHKYVPKSDLVRYRASKMAIERIAKEGRKYGVTLGIVSQRPSEISETIFSQCNNFIAMRLTNPDDQNYVKRLLPDTLGNLTDSMPSMQSGEALLIGESIIMPSIIKIDECSPKPSSNDIEYLKIWKEQWKNVDFDNIVKEWKK